MINKQTWVLIRRQKGNLNDVVASDVHLLVPPQEGSGGGGVQINDTTPSLTETYSSQKSVDLLANKADLVSGFVPSYQLPAYVDDILEYANLAAFPATGEMGKIYVAISPKSRQYRWTGSVYIQITNGLIASTDDVPEGSNLYFTTARVLSALLTGVSFLTGTAITAADSILIAFGKIQKQITDILADLVEVKVSQITITTAVSITTNTLSSINSRSQNGKNVIIDNGVNAINLSVLLSSGNFAASYSRLGVGSVTITAGTGITDIVDVYNATKVCNGAVMSSFTLEIVGTKCYLKMNNA